MHKTKGIIALDLDGTLLNSNKELTPGNVAALTRAAEAGYEIVPTTGRFYKAMPEAIRALSFIRYVIIINGAAIMDIQTGELIYQAEIPCHQAVEIMTMLDDLPVIYDCYMDNDAWMTGAFKEKVTEFVKNPHYVVLVRDMRHSVPELKAFLTERGQDVQKMQFFVKDPELRLKMLNELPERYENICTSSSVPENVEINQARANKGEALLALAAHLGLPRQNTISFGDGLNDLTMIEMAGVGIAMANAEQKVKEKADWITTSCDEDGVARGIEKFCFGQD